MEHFKIIKPSKRLLICRTETTKQLNLHIKHIKYKLTGPYLTNQNYKHIHVSIAIGQTTTEQVQPNTEPVSFNSQLTFGFNFCKPTCFAELPSIGSTPYSVPECNIKANRLRFIRLSKRKYIHSSPFLQKIIQGYLSARPLFNGRLQRQLRSLWHGESFCPQFSSSQAQLYE